MQFRAVVIPNSSLHRLWCNRKQMAGEVSGVRFRKVRGIYVSEDNPLPPDAVASLSTNTMIRLEMTSAPVPVAAPVVQPPGAAPSPEPAKPEPEPVKTSKGVKAKVDLRVPQKGWPVES